MFSLSCPKCLVPRWLCHQTGTQTGTPERGAHLGLLPVCTTDSLLGHCPSSGITPGDTPIPNSLRHQFCIPTLSRSEFHSSSLKWAHFVKVKDPFAQPISGKFMRGHFSEKSESFSKVTKPRLGSTKRFSVRAHLQGLLFLLPLGSRTRKGEHQQLI